MSKPRTVEKKVKEVPLTGVGYHDKRVRVKLTCDLTRYASGLVAGSLGYTNPQARATWGVVVDYDNGVRLDTLYKSLVQLVDDNPKHDANVQRVKTLMDKLGVTLRDLL